MFSPYRKENTGSCTTVMLLGSEGTGKHNVGKEISDMGKSINLKVHTCTSLPVQEDSVIYRTGVQFLCFFMHLTNKDSMTRLLDNMGKVDIAYFLGKSVIIANTKGNSTDEGIPQAQLTGLSAQYGIPVLFTNTDLDDEHTDVCRKIMRLIDASIGKRSVVSPLMYEGLGLSLASEDRTQTQQTMTPTVT